MDTFDYVAVSLIRREPIGLCNTGSYEVMSISHGVLHTYVGDKPTFGGLNDVKRSRYSKLWWTS